MANNLSQVFWYGMFDSEDGEEALGAIGRDNEDAFFDDESAEVVFFSLRMGRK